TDEDIEHLQRTLKRTLELFVEYDQDFEKNRENLELIIELINVDTLKSMQLLGVNYNAAIGEPLTIACSNCIKSKLSVESEEYYFVRRRKLWLLNIHQPV